MWASLATLLKRVYITFSYTARCQRHYTTCIRGHLAISVLGGAVFLVYMFAFLFDVIQASSKDGSLWMMRNIRARMFPVFSWLLRHSLRAVGAGKDHAMRRHRHCEKEHFISTHQGISEYELKHILPISYPVSISMHNCPNFSISFGAQV